ncbi:MAG: hypothetical protein SPF09_08700, partial [Bacteroidaceae bacterium]|nr:hypothetical protein [Bacteroidaceae bacterium]
SRFAPCIPEDASNIAARRADLNNNLIYLISLMYCKDNYFPAELYNEPIYILGETGAHLTPILTRSNP